MLWPAESYLQPYLWSLIPLLLMVCGRERLGAANRGWWGSISEHTYLSFCFSLRYSKVEEEKGGIGLHERFFYIYTLIFSSCFSPSLPFRLSFSLFLSPSIQTAVSPQFFPSSHSYSSPPNPFLSVSLLKRAVLPWIATKHGISSCSKPRHLTSYWDWKRQLGEVKGP